jgi:CubicO group peptidase (beta-lactamase class C family)
MRISIVTFIAFALGACAHPMQRPAEINSSALRAAIQSEVAQGFAGAILVARGGRPVVLESHGSEGGVAMHPDTRFWISSMGKQFVSAALLSLQDEGRLSLDDPLSRWIPDAPADKRGITIAQLLAHTSGLPQGYRGEQATSNEEAARDILATPLADQPGRRFIYSNENYQLAAAIVERASGRTYREFVSQRFFDRLRLGNIGIASGPGSGVAPTRGGTPRRLLEPQWGIGGHYASIRDLFAWVRALRSGRILSTGSRERLFTPVVALGEGQGALGWFVSVTPRGTRRIWTRGNDDFGPNGLIYTYPDRDLTIIVLSHAGQRTSELSHSRAMLAALEQALGL